MFNNYSTRQNQTLRILSNFKYQNIPMNTIDKRQKIIQVLQSSNDEQLIEEVYEMLHPKEAIENVDVAKLPIELQNKISRAIDDYKNGHFITQDQMKQKIAQGLRHSLDC